MRTGESDIIDVLLALEGERATGVLEFRAEDVLTRVFVERGVPVFAEAGVLGETLGHVLVREKILTTDQFAAVVRRMTDSLVEGNEHARLGEIIVELGMLERHELDAALTTQVEKKLIGCVHRGKGAWSFKPDAEAVGEVAHHPTPIRAVLLDACELWSEQRVSEIVDANRFPRLVTNIVTIANDFGLDDRELAIAKSLDGTRTASAVDAPVLLCALLCGRAIELLDAPSAEPIKPGEPVTATGRRRAFRSRALAREKAKSAIENLVREREAPLPPPRSERESQMFAEDEFQTGKRLLAQGKADAALPKLRAAAERTNAPLYRLYEDFAESRARGSFVNAAATKKIAIQIAKEDPENAFAHYVLGFLALEEKQPGAARRFFVHAYKLDPELVDAGRQVRLLEMRKETPAAMRPLSDLLPPQRRAEAPEEGESRARVLVLVVILVCVLAAAVFLVTRR